MRSSSIIKMRLSITRCNISQSGPYMCAEYLTTGGICSLCVLVGFVHLLTHLKTNHNSGTN